MHVIHEAWIYIIHEVSISITNIGWSRWLHTAISLLEAPCAKTSWMSLLFRAILGIMGALIVCFDIWRFKQVNNSETGFGGHRCDFEQHVPCLTVHVCMNSLKFLFEAPGASILWGRYYSVTKIQTHLRGWGEGASIREGASNRDIMVSNKVHCDIIKRHVSQINIQVNLCNYTIDGQQNVHLHDLLLILCLASWFSKVFP